MVGIGIVGIGFMGMLHYLAAEKLAKGKVVAVCSRDPKKLAGDWTGIQGNFGPKGTQVDLGGRNRHSDIAELLRDPAVDLVDLCVPNDEHARLAIQALNAGKHVIVEKPIALTTSDADAMVAAAKASGKLLMVAHVLPFFPEFAFAVEAAQSKRFGALKAAHFTRVISKPDWSSGIADLDRSGGPVIDLHIHDNHYIGLICGSPRAVQSRGVVENGAVVHVTTQYLYDEGGPAVSATSGAISQAGRPFLHGFEIYFERANLSYDSTNPLSVFLGDGTVDRPELGSNDPIDSFASELAVAVEAVETTRESPALAGELARRALVICRAEIESVLTGRSIALA